MENILPGTFLLDLLGAGTLFPLLEMGIGGKYLEHG